jgi:hypothetical protein
MSQLRKDGYNLQSFEHVDFVSSLIMNGQQAKKQLHQNPEFHE